MWARSNRALLSKYSSWEAMVPSYAMTNEETYVREGFRKNTLVYRCVMLLATSMASARLMGVVDTPEGETELPNADPLRRLLERPSTDHTGQADFVVEMVMRLMLAGEFPMYKVPGERTGRTVELQPLLSSKIEVKRQTNGERIIHYRPDPAKPVIKLTYDQVIFLKFRDPINRDRGLAPLAAAARETDTDNTITDWRNSFFANGAIPPGILTTEQEASEEQLEEWGVKWRNRFGGKKGVKNTPVLGGGLSYQATGIKPGELDLGNLTGLSETRICQAFGVPPIMVGAKIAQEKAQSYNNYVNARRSFWEETVVPVLRFITDGMTHGLTETGDRRRVAANTEKVPALQEDRDKKAERFGKAWDRGAAKRNEYREAIGLDPESDGDVYKSEPAEEPVEEPAEEPVS